MASTSETGHSKNVANFEDLISFCKGYGATYNPSKASIKADALTTLFTTAQDVLQQVKATKATYDNATNAREIAFEPLKKLSTRIVNALQVSGAENQTIDDAKTANNKVQGKRAGTSKAEAVKAKLKAADPTTELPKEVSVSQQSYDGLIDNFTKLIQTITAEPLYTPNEPELQTASLNTLLADLKTKNTGVINATTAWSNARIARDKTLYEEDNGLIDIALEVKTKVIFLPMTNLI